MTRAAMLFEEAQALLREKRWEAALAAVGEVLALDESYPNARNFAGWILLSKEPRVTGDLETAVAHFRDALRVAPADATPLVNLGDALVALGRDDEAIAALEARLGPGDALAPDAHNMLGWYFTRRSPDLARAAVHLREATRLRPEFGFAWVNLAWALDRAGDEEGCYRAYLEALTCTGDFDYGFALKRATEIEEAMRARGHEPPAPAAGSRAHARTAGADEVGFAILRELPAPHVPALRRARASPEGDVPRAGLATIVAGRPVFHATVSDLKIFSAVEVLAPGKGVPIFRSVQIHGPDVSAAAKQLAESLATDPDRDPESLNPIDAAFTVLDLLAVNAPNRRGYSVSGGADYYRPEAAAGMSVTPRDDGVSVGIEITARAGGGVVVVLLPESAGGGRTRLEIVTLAALREAAPRIVESTRRALASRDAMRARPFGTEQVAGLLLEGLRASGIGGKGRWEANVRRGTLRDSPSAWLVFKDGQTERGVLSIDESEDSCRVEGLNVEDASWRLGSVEDARKAMSHIVERVRVRLDRLTADALVQGERYRVLRGFSGIDAGDIVELREDKYVPYDGVHMYTFVADSRPGVEACLTEHSDADCAILRELHLHLARCVRPES